MLCPDPDSDDMHSSRDNYSSSLHHIQVLNVPASVHTVTVFFKAALYPYKSCLSATTAREAPFLLHHGTQNPILGRHGYVAITLR